MATILETINTVTDKIVSLVGTRANKDLSNLTELGEAKLVSGTSGLPVGSVIAYMGTDVPTGYLLMDGRTLSRTTYAALFAVIGTTQGAGDGKTTFGIADMTDGRYLMGSTVAGGRPPGTLISAGIPNISGIISCRSNSENGVFASASAAFHVGGTQASYGIGRSSGVKGTAYSDIGYSANRVSSLYGASTTVTPISLAVQFLIKY